jgi:ABC-type branched-subunit amino acid transport system ATPase component
LDVLDFGDVTKYYDNYIGIGGVTFESARGKTFGFLGPDRAGKTATMGKARPDTAGALQPHPRLEFLLLPSIGLAE